MSVDRATVHRIARLARIAITEDEAKRLEKELSGILDWVAQLDEIDTKGVEPMTRVVAMTMTQRKDEVTDGNCADDILRNAPAVDDHYFVVPKIVE
jgi:aspartyl-tRNA(Asn)/glutamyl-tRNA(Gln) amidotransferase subunit C